MTFGIHYLSFYLFASIGEGKNIDGKVIHSAMTVSEIYVRDWFPEDTEFNESCVAEGCQKLKNISLCPLPLEINAFRNITEIICDCMKGPICGIVADVRPIRSLEVSMEEFLPGLEIDGTSTLLPDTGYLSNISNIQLETPSNENQKLPMQLTMSIPSLRLHGGLQLDFRLETVFGQKLTASLTESTYDIGIQFISTIYLNTTPMRPYVDIKFVNPIVRVRPLFCGIDMPSGFPDILSLFTSQAQIILESSSLAKAIGKFLEKLYRGAIQVVSDNCKQSNSTI